jgi:hypothetical protein
MRRARECCDAHAGPRFAVQVDAQREPSAIVEELLAQL